ncbi:MAG: glycosyltransferase family 39 protein [Candidatus Omnitrophica bacterium]|nr:glycosyltransferase family 39 protein [Candidatus Omnitrophota bacterium]
MAFRPRFPDSSVLFLLLFFIALLPRLFCLWQVRHSVLVDYLPLDAGSYDRWGFLLSQGGTGEETFPGLPFYAYFLGGLYRIFGHHLEVLRTVQAVLGALTCALTFRITKDLTGSVLAAAGAFLAALLFRPAVFYEMFPMTETLAAWVCAALVFFLLRAYKENSLLYLFLAGILAGIGLGLRTNFWAVFPVLAAWLPGAFPGRRIKTLLAFLCGTVLVTAPLIASGPITGKPFSFPGYNAGISFFIGNGPYADGRSLRFPWVPPNDNDLPQVFRHAATWKTGERMNDAELSTFWYRETLGSIQKHPVKFAKLALVKLRLLVSGFEMPDIFSVSFLSPLVPAFFLFPLNFFWLLPWALGGLFLCFSFEKKKLLPALLLFSYAAAILIVLVHERYKLPLYPLLALYAGSGVAALWNKKVPQVRKIAACGLVLILLALSSDPVFVKRYAGTPSAGYHLLGLHYLHKKNYAEAAALFRTNLAVAPAARLADVHNSLGFALEQNGQWDEAAREYRAAVKLAPSYALPRHNLIRLEAEMKSRQEAGQ